MKTRAVKQWLNAFNLLVVATLIVLALYSAIGQQIFPHVGQYRLHLEQYLSKQLKGDVNIRTLSGGMEMFTPSVHIEGVTLHTDDDLKQAKISIAAIDAELDPSLSLANFTPVFKNVRLSGLYVRIDGDAKKPQQPIDDDDALLVKRLMKALLLQQHVELNNVTIENTHRGETKTLHLEHLVMTGDGFHRLITGSVSYGSENKVNAGLRLYTQGSPFQLDSFYARGELDLPDVDVDYWLNEIADRSIFKEFTASAQLKFEFKKGLLNYGKLSIASPTVYLNDGRRMDRVLAQIWAKQRAVDNWSFWVADSQFTLKNKPWQFSDVAVGIAKTPKGNRWQAYLKSMDIAYLHEFLNNVAIIPNQIKPLLSDLQPSGYLRNMNVILNNHDSGKTDYTIVADLENISTKPSGGIPGVTNVNGVLASSEKSGRVQFNGPQISLTFPQIYSDSFFFPYGQGQVDWHVSDQGVRLVGDGLALTMEQAEKVTGGFKVWLYKDEQYEDKLELNLSLKNAEVGIHQTLVPNMVSPALTDWLAQSLLAGSAKAAHYYLYMGLGGQAPPQSQLHLNVSDVALQYLPQWPVVSDIQGDVFVDNDQVYAHVNNANSLGGKLTDTQIVFEGVKNNTLWVHSQLTGLANDGFAYLQYTPLNKAVNNIMDSWRMTGEHTTSVGLSIPLNGDASDIGVDVSTELSMASLNLTDIRLVFDDIYGTLNYRTSKGLTSRAIKSSLWQQPLSSSISSDVHKKGFSTDIAFNGHLEIERLKQWLDLSLLKPVTGRTDLTGHFKISAEEIGWTGLQLSSDLVGVSLDLPAPYLKLADAKQAFEFKLGLTDGQKLALSYGDLVNVAMNLNAGELTAGQVYLGETEAYVPNEQGLEVLGHVSSIDVEQWLKVWRQLQSQKSNGSNKTVQAPIIRKIDISTDVLIYKNHQFEQVSAEINANNNAWDIYVEAPIAKGLVTWQAQRPIIFNLDYIHWPALSETQDDDQKETADVLADTYPTMFPDMNFSVDEIFLGPRNYGNWQGKLRVKDGTLSLLDIDGKIKKLSVKGSAHWVKPENGAAVSQSTQLDLQLFSDDIGGVQKAWLTKPVIEAKRTRVSFNLKWPDSPALVKSEWLNGEANVSLRDGRFLDAGDTGALSAFGILNFSAIGRRLRLDFSDVYQSGLHFDSVSGKANIKNGILTIVDTLDIKGPSAKFASSGTVNLNTKELNQALSVTFPVTSTLPLVAILAGFAPPIAASIFVGEQLVGDQIEKYTSATYKLDGTWDKPNLKIMKRFDNKIEGKQDQGFWYRMKDFFGIGGDD